MTYVHIDGCKVFYRKKTHYTSNAEVLLLLLLLAILILLELGKP